MEVPVYNMKGSQVGSLKIDESALGGEINPALIKQAYVRYHTNTRQGSARTKNRHEVEGSTRKIYKQKGTGNARHGDKKSNLFKGGGHGHSKKRTREDFRPEMPKKMRRKANRSAFLAKLLDNEVRIIDSLGMSEPKTKAFREFLEAIKVDNSAVVALNGGNAQAKNVLLSGRNVDGVTLVQSDQINVFNMLNHRYLVIGKAELEAWLNGPSSQTGKSAKTAPLGRTANGEAK
ncbi:MAG: 50S ribosomal protein L4 [Planctomycetota bacterium]|jgi:large subunit ribosomal protein L4|nr:50S ribosomal protein L4 [Planctomycetota bacterium]